MKKSLLYLCCLASFAATAANPPTRAELEALTDKGKANAIAHTGDLSRLLSGQDYRTRMNQAARDPFFNRAAKDAQNMQQAANERVMQQGITPDGEAIQQAGARTFVFISRSMPDSALMPLLRYGADNPQIVFVMNGWGSANIDDAFKWSEELNRKFGGREPTIIIHPKAFETYKISKVPAMVHQDADNKWYLMQGTTTIDATIKEIQARNFARPISQQWPVGEKSQIKVDEDEWKRINWSEVDKAYEKDLREQLEGRLTLPWATENKTYRFKPIYTLEYDMRNEKGKILLPRGAKINLLAANPKAKTVMLFIDGRDPWQIKFAQGVTSRYPNAIVFYTKLGNIMGQLRPAYPLIEQIKDRMQVNVVPAAYIQDGIEFQVKTFKRQ